MPAAGLSERPEITVACLWWGQWCGDLGPVYVERLRNGAARNLTVPHRFVCFTDWPEKLPGDIETLPMGVPEWRWNLRKMALYRPDNGLEGRVLAFDLDTVITGNIDDVAGYDGRFCVVEDFYRKGKNGGGLIGFEAGTLAEELYEPVTRSHINVATKTKGAERFWYDMQMPDADHWQDLYPGRMSSFKPKPNERLTELPDGVSIVHFHGAPRVHEASAPWISHHWR